MTYELEYFDRNKQEIMSIVFEAETDKKARNRCERILEGKNYTEPVLYLVEEERDLALF